LSDGIIEVVFNFLEFVDDVNDGTVVSEFLAHHDLDEGGQEWSFWVSGSVDFSFGGRNFGFQGFHLDESGVTIGEFV